MLFKNATIYTMEQEPFVGDFKIDKGVFTQVGKNLTPDEGEDIQDLNGLYVFPGLVESHCHLGMEETAIRFEGDDVNEITDPITPNMRGIDGCNPMDETVELALKGGVTTVAAGPGSANVLGGTFFAYKTKGNCIDEMTIENPIAMKAAFGENPKRCYQGKKIDTRMQISALLRETLEKTKEYMEKKEAGKDVAYDQKLEAMIPVVKRELPLKCHAHRADDILTAIRIAKEENIKITLDHVTDARCILPQIKESGFPCICGPALTHKSKFELANMSFETPNELYKAGILFSIITDSPVIPQQYLSLSAALAAKAGLPEYEAIKAITINPAKILGLDNRVGSIKVGKDADFVVCTKNILDTQNEIKSVYVDGKKAA
ncbi:amidohydrolase [Holdemanella biformis]|uniref:amidohydrolase n=2 Tax=Holdemanella TaxID=1573535 RepID=UPI001C2619BF|nr:amidohydrolase [Holdemanella biformis]MBU9896130.1 amidohydrolase [Holdemanella biformis]MBV3417220.1 amidohydrolase [Holdemanella biformis]